MSEILKKPYSYGDTEFAFQKSFYCDIHIRVKNYFQEHTQDFLDEMPKGDDLRFYMRALMDPIADLLKNKFTNDIENLDSLYHEICDGLLNMARKCKSKKLYVLACKSIISEVPLDFLCLKYQVKDLTKIIDMGCAANGDILKAIPRIQTNARYKDILDPKIQHALFNFLYLITTNENLVTDVLNNKSSLNEISLFSVFDTLNKELKKSTILELNHNLANMLMSLTPLDIDKISSYIEPIQKTMKSKPTYKLRLELLETFLIGASTQERLLHLTHANNPEFKNNVDTVLPQFDMVP